MESMNLRIHTYNDCKEDPDCSMNLSIIDNVTTPINYKYFFWTLHRSMSRNNVMDRLWYFNIFLEVETWGTCSLVLQNIGWSAR